MTKCIVCSKSAYFNIPGQTAGKYCSTHKEEGMVNVKDKRCTEPGCTQRPSFNILGKKPVVCSIHKTEDMVNVMTKFCEMENCMITPTFNILGKKGGRFCATHKEDGMVDVVTKRCIETNCNKAPSYGTPGQQPQYCSEHKKAGMVDTKHSTCLIPDCNCKSPSYRYTGDKFGTYCSKHKLPGMIDIKHKKCQYVDCKLSPSFNYIDETNARYCKIHRLDGMIDIVHRKCIEPACTRRPIYNTSLEINPIYCVDHKTQDMIDVHNKKCASSWCVNRAYRTSMEGYCTYCFVNLFPEKPTARNYKTKEKTVVDYVVDQFPTMTWISDKRIQDGCSKRRPDLFLDLGYQVIIIEVDENQHIDYDCSCENKRLMELSQDVGHRSIVFIRFNPDDYINTENIKIKTCWSINAQGLSVVTKNNSREWNDRLKSLKTQIQYWIDNKTEKTVEIIQLYYDEY